MNSCHCGRPALVGVGPTLDFADVHMAEDALSMVPYDTDFGVLVSNRTGFPIVIEGMAEPLRLRARYFRMWLPIRIEYDGDVHTIRLAGPKLEGPNDA